MLQFNFTEVDSMTMRFILSSNFSQNLMKNRIVYHVQISGNLIPYNTLEIISFSFTAMDCFIILYPHVLSFATQYLQLFIDRIFNRLTCPCQHQFLVAQKQQQEIQMILSKRIYWCVIMSTFTFQLCIHFLENSFFFISQL